MVCISSAPPTPQLLALQISSLPHHSVTKGTQSKGAGVLPGCTIILGLESQDHLHSLQQHGCKCRLTAWPQCHEAQVQAETCTSGAGAVLQQNRGSKHQAQPPCPVQRAPTRFITLSPGFPVPSSVHSWPQPMLLLKLQQPLARAKHLAWHAAAPLEQYWQAAAEMTPTPSTSLRSSNFHCCLCAFAQQQLFKCPHFSYVAPLI